MELGKELGVKLDMELCMENVYGKLHTEWCCCKTKKTKPAYEKYLNKQLTHVT